MPLTSDLPLLPAEAAAFACPPAWSPPELMERGGRRLTMGPYRGAPWRNLTTPYFIEPMLWCAEPWLRELTVEAGNQLGKTEFLYNCWGWCVVYSPAMAMLVMQDETAATRVMRDRILPMVAGPIASPFLAELFTGVAADKGQTRLAFANGAILYPAWYTSPNTTETFACEQLFLDEPDFAPAGTDIERIHRRTTTYPHTRKIVTVCKPLTETGPTHRQYLRADVRYLPHFACLACRRAFPATWAQIKYPDATDPAEIRRARLAYLECPHCHQRHNDHQRDLAVRLAQELGQLWQPDRQVTRPVSKACRIPAWLSPFVSLSELAEEWLRANHAKKAGDLAPLETFLTTRAGEPWSEQRAKRTRVEDQILLLRDDRPRGLVPRGTLALTAGVDTQDHGFWYTIRAWANPSPRCLSSWLIREGYVLTWDDLERILWQDQYLDADAAQAYPILRAFQDSAGHRTAEVYDHTRTRPGLWFPTKGEQRLATPWRPTTIDYLPGSRQRIAGGLTLILVHTTYFKNELDRRLHIPPGDPGAFLLHRDTTLDYAQQMTAEYRDDDGLWYCPSGRPNHQWDGEVLNLAAADHLGVRFWAPAEATEPTNSDREPTAKPKSDRRLPW